MPTDPVTNRKAARAYAENRRAIDGLLVELQRRLNEHARHLLDQDGVRGGHVWEAANVCVRLQEVVDLLPPAPKEA